MLLSRLVCKKNVRTKTIRGKTFINIWITKVKLFWNKSGAGVLTLQRNSYLSGPFSRFLVIFYPLSPHTPISVNNRGRAPAKYVNKLAIGFFFLYRKLNNMDGAKQQDSSDSTLGFKWIKKNHTKYCVVIYS